MCISTMMSQNHSSLDSTLIANEIRDLVREVLTILIFALGVVIKNRFNYIPTYRKLWDAKQKAIVIVFGDQDKSYKILPKWLHAIEEFNIGCRAKFTNNPIDHPTYALFDRLFCALAPLIERFKYCQLVISIDATFLYEKYMEKLLIATTVDRNNQIFLLAFAIIYVDSSDTQGWFLACMINFVTNQQNNCLISD